MKKILLLLLLVIGYWLLVISSATAATYYIDAVNGSNVTGDGSSGTPWQTITYATASATSGDIILTAAGTYSATMPGSVETFPMTIPSGVTLKSNASPSTSATIEGFTINVTTTPNNSNFGVAANASSHLLSNTIVALSGGVVVNGAGAKVESNTITSNGSNSNTVAVLLNAQANILNNTITLL